MIPEWTPMRWPSAWKDAGSLSLLEGSGINCLIFTGGDDLGAVRAEAERMGMRVAMPDALPQATTVVKGKWPGIKMLRKGGIGAGPTGVAWVDTNGWAVRRAIALQPDTAVWVDAAPDEKALLNDGSYVMAMTDSAAYGGRWMVTLQEGLAAGIAARKPDSMAAWKKISSTSGFFAANREWSRYRPEAVVGLVSDFSGPNAFFTGELINLMGRAGQHYRLVVKDGAADADFRGLRALLYVDAAAPAPALRDGVIAFVKAGGTLITGPQWGEIPGSKAAPDTHPRYSSLACGKGKIAIAPTPPADPYILANDSVVLVSHRYDMVRFWNGGAVGSYYAAAPDRKQAVVHLLFYANRGPDSASVRVAGRYRTVRLLTLEEPAPRKLDAVIERDAVEVHLPEISRYAALELGV